MNRFLGVLIAIVFYAALLLFGGIFFTSRDEQPKDKQEILADLFTKDDKPKTKETEKAKPKEPPPETRTEDKPPPDVVEEMKKMDAKIAELNQPPTNAHPTELIDLAAISNALDGSMGGDGGFTTGGLPTFQPGGSGGGGGVEEDILSLNDLDQQPRVVFQAAPVLTVPMRAQVPATVRVIFIVDAGGKVTNPIVQQSSNPLFDDASLAAVKQWKFEPGKHNGKEVAFRMSVPITFPKRP
jgi:periplasmic protein TonB